MSVKRQSEWQIKFKHVRKVERTARVRLGKQKTDNWKKSLPHIRLDR
jgi:hypothetical protein